MVEGVARVQIARQPALQRAGLRQRVAVDFQQIVHRHAVAGQVEIGQIGQQEADGVAQAAIAFGDALQDGVRNRQLARVIRRGHPQTQNVGAQGVVDFCGR